MLCFHVVVFKEITMQRTKRTLDSAHVPGKEEQGVLKTEE